MPSRKLPELRPVPTEDAPLLDLAAHIDARLGVIGEELRPTQLRGMHRIVQSIRAASHEGLIKQPPSAGKSRMIAETNMAISRPSIGFVPTQGLRTQMHESHTEIGYPADRLFVIEPKAGASALQQIDRSLDAIAKQGMDFWTLILTYRSYLNLFKGNKEMFSLLMKWADVLFSDESHESLGKKISGAIAKAPSQKSADQIDFAAELLTAMERDPIAFELAIAQVHSHMSVQQLLELLEAQYADSIPALSVGVDRYQQAHGSLNAQRERMRSQLRGRFSVGSDTDVFSSSPADILTRTSESLEVLGALEAENVLQVAGKQRPHLHLHFTGSPQLLGKSVQSVHGVPIIDWVNLGELIEDGVAIMPRHRSVGRAIYRSEDPVNITQRALEELVGNDRFVMEDGSSVIQAVSDTYIEEREACDGYLPALGFCETIDQAERAAEYLRSQGIRAERSTTGNKLHGKGLPVLELKRRLMLMPDNDDFLDIGLTVGQAGLGIDMRPVRAAAWYRLSNSPAVLLQYNGRIIRALLPGDPWPAKCTENTVIIEPQWEVAEGRFTFREIDAADAGISRTDGALHDRVFNGRTVFTSENSIEAMIALGELDLEEVLRRDVIFKRIRFNVQEYEHLRVLIDRPERLIDGDDYVDLNAQNFSHDGLGWNVKGSIINERLFGGLRGREAAEYLLHMIWPDFVFTSSRKKPVISAPVKRPVADSVPMAEVPLVSDVEVLGRPDGSHKAMINQRSQLTRSSIPQYAVVGRPASPLQNGAQLYTIRCTYIEGDTSYTGDATSNKKLWAEHHAADRVLRQLPAMSSLEMPVNVGEKRGEVHKEKPGVDARNLINGIANAQGATLSISSSPTAESGARADIFLGTCVWQPNGGKKQFYTALGIGKKVAEEWAMVVALEHLGGMPKGLDASAVAETSFAAKFLVQARQLPVGALNSYCSAFFNMQPDYSVKSAGAEHEVHTYRLIDTCFGTVEISEKFPKNGRKKHKKKIARSFLEKLVMLGNPKER